MKNVLASLMLVLSVSACGDLSNNNSNITATHPTLTVVASDCVARLDSTEAGWFRKFQEGSFFVAGWKKRTDEIVSKAPNAEQVEVRAVMDTLGYRIGCEWSRDNSIRRINTEDLQNWGDDLQVEADSNPSGVLVLIKSLLADVEAILVTN